MNTKLIDESNIPDAATCAANPPKFVMTSTGPRLAGRLIFSDGFIRYTCYEILNGYWVVTLETSDGIQGHKRLSAATLARIFIGVLQPHQSTQLNTAGVLHGDHFTDHPTM